MREERPDASLLIGLHKLAEQNGEGLVPELYALLSARGRADYAMTNVVSLPRPLRVSTGALREESARVLAFRR